MFALSFFVCDFLSLIQTLIECQTSCVSQQKTGTMASYQKANNQYSKMTIDLVNRDPNNINDNLQCQFEDVLAEPDGAHSIECVWKLSNTCFTCSKNLCYKISTLLCGICFAICWGFDFACIALTHVWCITPCLKHCAISCGVLKRMWAQCVGCYIEPICEAYSVLFSAFKKK